MPKCHLIYMELVQRTPPEDLEVLSLGVKAAAAQVRSFSRCTVTGSANTVGSPFYHEKTLDTYCYSVYCVYACSMNLTYDCCGSQINNRTYTEFLRFLEGAFD